MCWNLLCLPSKAWRRSSSSISSNGKPEGGKRGAYFFFFPFHQPESDLCLCDVKRLFRADDVATWLSGGRNDCVSPKQFTPEWLLDWCSTTPSLRASCGKFGHIFLSRWIPSKCHGPHFSLRAPLGAAASTRTVAARNAWQTPRAAQWKLFVSCSDVTKEKLSPFRSWHLQCLILCLAATTTMRPLSFFFRAAGLVKFLVVFAVARGSAVLGLQRQQPSEQDGLSASFHCFQPHQTLDVLCANVYANYFAGGHWTTLSTAFYFHSWIGHTVHCSGEVSLLYFLVWMYLLPSWRWTT